MAEVLVAEERSDDGTIGSRVGRGVAWSGLNAAVLRLGQFLMSIVVARIVSPGEFGVFVVALTVYTIIINVSEIGVGAAVVREPHRTPQIAPTVATVAIGTSALLAGLMTITAPYLADALGAHTATGAIRVLALTVLVGGAGAVPGALLTRDYQQKRRFAVDAAFFLSSNAVLVVMALLGSGVMALAWSRVVGQVVSTVLLTALASERYWPRLDLREARHLLRFGLPLAGANLLSFMISNLDFVLIGRLRGALRLGYYNLAFNVSVWPVSIFTAILNNVTVTTLSRVRHSRAQLELHLSCATSALAAAAFPVSALCAALSTPLVQTVYGERWKPAAAVLAVLAAFGSIRVLIALLSDLLVALGRTKRLLGLQVVWLVALLPLMVFCVHRWGIVGAGIAHCTVALFVVVPSYVLTIRRRTGIGFGWAAHSIAPPLGCAIVSGVVAHLVAALIAAPVAALVAGGVCGCVTYLLILQSWLRRLVRQLATVYRRDPKSVLGTSAST